MEHWLSLFIQERARPRPDEKLLATYAYKLLQSNRNLATWGSGQLKARS
jgi:hypothetical protein